MALAPGWARRSGDGRGGEGPSAGARRQVGRPDRRPLRGDHPRAGPEAGDLPISTLKTAFPVLGNPASRSRAVPLTYDQFRYAFANAVSEDEAEELYETFSVPASGKPLCQAAIANLNPWTEAEVDSRNPERGPPAGHLRRAGRHRPAGDRARVLRAAAGQRGRDRALPGAGQLSATRSASQLGR